MYAKRISVSVFLEPAYLNQYFTINTGAVMYHAAPVLVSFSYKSHPEFPRVSHTFHILFIQTAILTVPENGFPTGFHRGI